MKQWTSRFRAQRLRERPGGRGAMAAGKGAPPASGASFAMLVGMLLWVAVCVLFHTGRADATLTFEQTMRLLRGETEMVGVVALPGNPPAGISADVHQALACLVDGLGSALVVVSALIVMGHVKEGLTLAMLHKLPPAVVDIIRQHHGTGLAAYFHHKAGQQALTESQGPGRTRATAVDETPYRYPGPRPLSRETTIVMLADAVEAASRSIEKPSPAHIDELVDRLVDTRFEDGQLDESEMTLRELSAVKRAFVFCLTNMMHSRIPYPHP